MPEIATDEIATDEILVLKTNLSVQFSLFIAALHAIFRKVAN